MKKSHCFVLIAYLCGLFSCIDPFEWHDDGVIVLTTEDAVNVTATTAKTGGSFVCKDCTLEGFGVELGSTPNLSGIYVFVNYQSIKTTINHYDCLISDLGPNTLYYFRTCAYDDKSTRFYGPIKSFKTGPPTETMVVDVNGNAYNSDTFGNRIWTTENIKTISYSDGMGIPNLTDADQWRTTTLGAYICNNQSFLGSKMGNFYNGYAAQNEKLCPPGWHVATDEDWRELCEHFGQNDVAVQDLMYGKFKARTDGCMSGTGEYLNPWWNQCAYWWSSSGTYWKISLEINKGWVLSGIAANDFHFGCNIRLVKNP